jgi:hypothetical protein
VGVKPRRTAALQLGALNPIWRPCKKSRARRHFLTLKFSFELERGATLASTGLDVISNPPEETGVKEEATSR